MDAMDAVDTDMHMGMWMHRCGARRRKCLNDNGLWLERRRRRGGKKHGGGDQGNEEKKNKGRDGRGADGSQEGVFKGYYG